MKLAHKSYIMWNVGWWLLIFSIEINGQLLTEDSILTVKTPPFNTPNPILRDKYAANDLLNFTQLANKYGYLAEEHTVTTDDGYILTIFRISGHKNTTATKRKPLLLMHGFLCNADVWLLPGSKTCLGLQFFNDGYDVWFGNVRGNDYGRKHITYDPDTSEEFWRFSYDEMAQYDVPAIIDYVLDVTQCDDLAYIGHSQGTTMLYAMSAYRPDYYSKVKVMMALAPVAFMKHTRNPILRVLTSIRTIVKTVLDTLAIRELFANSHIATQTLELLAQLYPPLSGTITAAAVGDDREQLPDHVMPVLWDHIPRGVSTQNAVHLGQGFHSNKFQRFDRGPLENMEVYGLSTPPEYDLSLVETPVAVFIGLNDELSSPRDVDKLLKHLPNVLEKIVVPWIKWSHFDHLIAKDARKFVGSPILRLLKQYY